MVCEGYLRYVPRSLFFYIFIYYFILVFGIQILFYYYFSFYLFVFCLGVICEAFHTFPHPVFLSSNISPISKVCMHAQKQGGVNKVYIFKTLQQ